MPPDEKQVHVEGAVSITDAHESAATGVNVGSMGQGGAASINVTIDAAARAEQLEPPPTVPRALTELWKQITACNFRIDDLTVLMARTYDADRQERIARQAEADAYRHTMLREQAAMRRWLYLVSAFVLVQGVALVVVAWTLWQLCSRLGWLVGG